MVAPSPLLVALSELAVEAGREIFQIYQAGFSASAKSDGSPVTLADQRAEAIIRAGLARLYPDVPIVGEEGVEAGDRPEVGDRFLLVDPLDGTREFVSRRSGEYTVNIALIERGAPTTGVVYAPSFAELFAGEPGCAFFAKADPREPGFALEPTAVADPPAKDVLRVLTSKAGTQRPALQRLLNRLPPHRLTAMSSSLKLARLACGQADLYLRDTGVSEWDLAAGHAVLRAAGGDILRLDGSAFTYAGLAGEYGTTAFVAYGGEAGRAAARALTEAN